MKRFLTLVVTALSMLSLQAQVVYDSVWTDKIKTVTLYRSGIDQEAPVILLGSGDRLQLQFDLIDDQPSLFRYTLRHCDAEWRVDDLDPYDYIGGMEDAVIDNYSSSFTTLQTYYHYIAAIPSTAMTLLMSGNYVVEVHPEDFPDSTVLTWRFMVSEELLSCGIEVVRPTSGVDITENQEVNVSMDGKGDLTFGEYLPFTLSPTYLKPYLQQNGRLDNMRQLSFSGYAGGRLCYRWKDENVFQGGNNFRYFDFSNLHGSMYNVQRVEQYGGEYFAILRPDEDRSRKHYDVRQGLSGGFKVNVWDRNDPQVEADYAWVNLSLPMPQPYLNGNIYVVGALTQWRMDDGSRMEWNPKYKAYTKRLYLKQGYYSYQLLFLPVGEREGLTATLEGNHIEAPNDYHLYVYYRAHGDRYDRLLAVQHVKSQAR